MSERARPTTTRRSRVRRHIHACVTAPRQTAPHAPEYVRVPHSRACVRECVCVCLYLIHTHFAGPLALARARVVCCVFFVCARELEFQYWPRANGIRL